MEIKNFFRNKHRVKVPTILQMESTECGAACLSMILAYYKLWIPLEKMRQECGVNRNGSKVSNIMKVAKRYNCEVHGYRWEAENVREEGEFPMIIHWEFNHFVVLEGIEGDTVYLNDPAIGRRTVHWEEFLTAYTGISITIAPNENFQPSGQKYSFVKAIYQKLLNDKPAIFFLVILSLCMIIPGIALPIFSQIFLDEILTGKHLDWTTNFFVAMAVSFFICGALNWLRTMILTRQQQKLTLADSSNFFWHLLRLPMQFFHQRYAAEVASRVKFNGAVAKVLSGNAAVAFLDFFVAIFFLILLFQYNVTLTLIGIFFTALDTAIFFVIRQKLSDLTMRIQQDAGKEYGVAVNGLLMIDSIKATGSESDFFMKWAGYRAKVLAATQETQIWRLSFTLLPNLLAGLNGALIMTFGGFSIMEGAMTAGMFVAFQSLMENFQAPVNKLLNLNQTLQETEMQMQRLEDARKYEADKLNYPEEKIFFPKKRLSGELELKNISFGYSPLEKPLLENFNLHLLPGRWAAIVGSSGSGKSTLAKIVTGLYEEWEGQILFDGVDRKKIPRAVIVNSLSSVDQDIFQISGTVRQNITLFDDSINQTDILQAAQDACIHEDILKIDGSYSAEVKEGGLNFSGGQRQRLEIARALATKPSILILDEATSALDPATEKIVLDNIRHRGCSCLIIAHRLSTIRDCDEIIVLEDGKIVERGKHREMILHDGPYKKLIEDRYAKS